MTPTMDPDPNTQEIARPRSERDDMGSEIGRLRRALETLATENKLKQNRPQIGKRLRRLEELETGTAGAWEETNKRLQESLEQAYAELGAAKFTEPSLRSENNQLKAAAAANRAMGLNWKNFRAVKDEARELTQDKEEVSQKLKLLKRKRRESEATKDREIADLRIRLQKCEDEMKSIHRN